MNLDVFYQDFMQEVAARANSSSDFTECAFRDLACEYLLDAGAVNDFTPCSYKHRGIRADGFAFVDDEATLDLFVVDFRGDDTPASLTKTEMSQSFKKVEVFFEKSLTETFVAGVEVAHPAYGLLQQILEESKTIKHVRFHLLSNAILSNLVKKIPSKLECNREWSYKVWDLKALSRLSQSEGPEKVLVDFDHMFGRPLPCLASSYKTEQIQSYLAIIPGSWLAAIYDQYGGRLLEQNVRTFLQVRGGVNKAIRRTILDEPEMFFSYNNGISATAEAVKYSESDSGSHIHRLENFQIVNGGQTTASIYHALKKDGVATLGQINVQMKLSVVSTDNVHNLVPKISKYANSQNKITDADFFSNHPFHVRIEGLSRRIWAPAVQGSQVQTHWFYERARGQYGNHQTYLTAAKKIQFQLQNPRSQLLNKTDLAKYINTFRRLPNEVSLGAQKNFGKFAEYISERWDKDESLFNEVWFQTAVAQAIIFRSAEKLVQEASWYAQGYRANTVTYAISLLMHSLKERKMELNYRKIWLEQRISAALRDELLTISAGVQSRIIEAAALYGVSNVTEWCKRRACWDDIEKNVICSMQKCFIDELNSEAVAVGERRAARREQKQMGEAEATMAVVKCGAFYWKSILNWSEANSLFTPSEIRTLKIGAAIPKMIPTGIQSLKLIEIYAKAVRSGFNQVVPFLAQFGA